MGDNIALPTGQLIATKEIAGAHFQKAIFADENGALFNPANTAKQDIANTALAGILSKLTSDPANQTTLAAILAKLADPATAALQEAMVALLTAAQAYLADLAATAISENPVSSAPDITKFYDGSSLISPKFAPIALAASGDLVAAVAEKKILVTSLFLLAAADVTVKFQSDGAVDLTGAMPVGAKGGFVLPPSAHGHLRTAAGKKLNLVLGAGVAVAGALTYLEVA